MEPGLGQTPQRVTTSPGLVRGGVKYIQTALAYDLYPATGFELSVCWEDRDHKTISYRPAVSVGGTFDWTRLRRTVVAPAGAAFAE